MKLLEKIKNEFGFAISDIYCDNEGISFGKKRGSLTWWVELKNGYKVDGHEQVHESTLTDCYKCLKQGLYKD